MGSDQVSFVVRPSYKSGAGLGRCPVTQAGVLPGLGVGHIKELMLILHAAGKASLILLKPSSQHMPVLPSPIPRTGNFPSSP